MSDLRIATGLLVTALLVNPVCHGQEASQIKIGSQSSETSTTAANTYFTTAANFPEFTDLTASTREFWGSTTEIGRPVEIKELARALRNDVDLIYEYVHDNIRTTFTYGLQKGALGALIDQSGSPFDQAQLMIELLRESGYSARFKEGTFRVNATQATAWLGLSNSTAIRKTFRDGGIPLNYSGTGPTYTIGHVWVEVTIPGSTCGSTCWFNPSYKEHVFKTQLTLSTLMSWGANEFSTNAMHTTSFFNKSWSGLVVQSPLADPVWIRNINHVELENKLQSYAVNLLNNLKSPTHSAKEIDDVIGGQEIIRTGTTPVRNNGTFTGFTTTAVHTWDCTDAQHCGVPDPYRTRLKVMLVHALGQPTGTVYMRKTFFVDEIYGRRLIVDTPQVASLPDTGGPGTYENFCFQLALDGAPIATTTAEPTQLGCDGSGGLPGGLPGVPFGRTFYLDLYVNHPYAAGAGTYMDLGDFQVQNEQQGTFIRKRADFLTPVVIVHGWGDVSPALVSKFASEQRADRLLPVVDPDPGAGGYEPGEKKSDSALDHTMVKMGASYLAQYSRMAEIQKRVGNAQHAMHHMVGIVYTETNPANGWALNPNPPSTDNEWMIVDRGVRINLDGAISVNSNTGVAADRQTVIQSTLAVAAALEGSVFEQMMDATTTGSTATRFRWGNENIAALKYYLFRPTSPPPGGWFGADFTNLGCVPFAQTPAVIPDYVNATAGFWAIAAAENCLGPGHLEGVPEGSGLAFPSMERGPAFFAFKPAQDSVAHVVGYNGNSAIAGQWFKGGGVGAAPEYSREFDAAGAASLLKDKFEDRSRLHGVDLNSGELTYSAPVDLRLGEGGFPYELSFQRTFKPGASASVGLPDGWAHNLDVRAAYSGDGLAKMGLESAAAAAETIAAVATLQQIYNTAPTLDASTTNAQMRDHLKRWVLGPFVANWWSSKLTYNVVTINAGHDARQFTRLANGDFNPARNGVGTLTQTGQRFLDNVTQYHDVWDYHNVSFTYTSPEKDVQQFAYYEYDNYQGTLGLPTENVGRKSHGWHMTSWTFPYGVTLTYNYSLTMPGAGVGQFDRLASLSNNLGRTLTLNYAQSPDADAPLLTSVTDGQSRTVTIAQPATSYMSRILTQVTLPEAGNGAEIARYEYVGDGENSAAVLPDARPQRYPKLYKVFAPSDATNAKVQVDYDRIWRVKEYRDAVAILTPAQRQPWSFFITGNTRGARVDPASGEYKAYYDTRSRAISLTDEENRAVVQAFDNHDRVSERTFPEGNKIQFAYDDVTQNIKTLTQVRKSSTYWTGTDTLPSVSATYDPSCGRIKTVTDAKGAITTWNYNTTTCNLTNIVQPQVSNPEAGGAMASPTTSFLYNTFGQVTQITDPTSRVVNIEYDATTKYRLRRRVNQTGLDITTTYGHNAYGDTDSVDGPRTDVTDVTTYNYDKMRRLTQIFAPLCSRTRNIMDLDGDVYRVDRAKDCTPTWQSWEKTFTPTKKVATEDSPTHAITQYGYDGVDRVSVVTDPDGRKVFTDYFKDGKTKQIVKAYQSVNLPQIEYVTYTYTPNGQIDTVKDANANFTNLNYDAFDRLHRTFHADPANGTPCAPTLPHSAAAPAGCTANQRYEQLLYDANGNVTSKRNRSGQTLTFAFDALNREITRNVPANTLTHFARTLTTNYDLASRKYDVTVVELPLANQTLSHRYDAVGRVDFVDDSLLGATNHMNYSYDKADNRTGVAYPGGMTINYTYDELNRVDTVLQAALVLADYDWDTLSRRDLVKLNVNAFNMDLAYEADDDLQTLTHTGPQPLTFTFGRNNSGQITTLTASDGTFLSRPAATQGIPYVPDRLNRYSSVAGTAFGWDNNGNLTGDGVYTFEYDEENRLRSAVGGGFTTSYEYDPLGRRRAKTVNGTVTRYVSDNAEEIEERDGANAVQRRYVYGSGIDERIAMIEVTTPANCAGGGRCFYLSNWQGSATTLVNQDGTLKASYHYGPYGEAVGWSPADATTGNPFRYTGRRYDPETGLYYYRARYYSPKLGRFLQTDPVGAEDDHNRYAYVRNDPQNAVDPSGMWCVLGIGTTCPPTPPPTLEQVTVTAKRDPPPVVGSTTAVIPWTLEFPVARIAPVVGASLILSDMIFNGCGDSGTVGACAEDNAMMAEQKPSDKTRRSKPARGTPPGTVGIDQWARDKGKSHEWVEGTKDDVERGPPDWVGVAPNGDIITTEPDGSAKNNGPSDR